MFEVLFDHLQQVLSDLSLSPTLTTVLSLPGQQAEELQDPAVLNPPLANLALSLGLIRRGRGREEVGAGLGRRVNNK